MALNPWAGIAYPFCPPSRTCTCSQHPVSTSTSVADRAGKADLHTVGPVVAVPVHLTHGVLSSRVSRIVHDIEDSAHLLLDLRERGDGQTV